jgi:hypothetical protein
MHNQIKEIYDNLSREHHNLAYFAEHLILSIDQFKDERVKLRVSEGKGIINPIFFTCVFQCQQIIVDELKKASQHQDKIEARYEEIASIKLLQKFKENVPLSHKDLPIYVQELFKRFGDLKNRKLVKIGQNYLDKKEIDLKSERLSLNVIDEVEKRIFVEMQKTFEDIKNTGKPDYIKNYNDGIM